MLAHMLHAAVQAGLEAGVDVQVPVQGPLRIPTDFYTLGFWQRILGEWDPLPLNRPTHLELHTDEHVRISHPKEAFRRLAITLPLSWARLVLAGMQTYTPVRPNDEPRASLPIFNTDFVLAPTLPGDLGERHTRQAVDALRRFKAPRRRDIGSPGQYNTAIASLLRRMEPIARLSLKGPFAKEEVKAELLEDGVYLKAGLVR